MNLQQYYSAKDYEKLVSKGKRKYKHNAKGQRYDGKFFHSKRELKRYKELVFMEKGEHIKDLKTQVPFKFFIGGELMFTYYADFVYTIVETDKEVVEDSKGQRLPMYKLKKKIIEKVYGIKIKET